MRNVLRGVRTSLLTGATAASCLLVPAQAAIGQTPSPGPSPSGSCAPIALFLETNTITATGSGIVTISTRGSGTLELLAYSRPSTDFVVVRTAPVTGDEEVAPAFRLSPPTNTRMYARWQGCSDVGRSSDVVLNVRTALTIAAERLGPLQYRFYGDSLPARSGGLVISLYRHAADGRLILTAQTRADSADGNWSLTRKFTGSGRFAFSVRTGQDLQNAPGMSSSRPTVIH